MKTLINRVVILFCLCVITGQVMASSDAGVEISAGLFQLKITYNAADDKPSDLSYLSQSDGVMFDLVNLFQHSYEKLAGRNEHFWADVSFESRTIEILEKKSCQWRV